MIINDGTGTGNQVQVDEVNRLRVHATMITEQTHHSNLGSSYNLNSGQITLTSANESAVYYMKNNELNNFVVTSMVVGLGPSTGGSSAAIPVIKVTRNPTGGTVVSDATNADIASNRNFGSNNTLTADIFKGAEGKTLTGDTDHLLVYQPANGRVFLQIDEVLPKGTSLGVTITPQTSNTSMTCYAAIIGYLEEEAP